MDLLADQRAGGFFHLVYIRRTEILAGIAILLHAASVADVGIGNDQVGRLIFFMLGAGVVKVCELVKGQFAVAFGFADDLRAFSAVSRKLVQMLHSRVPGMCRIDLMQSATAA